jgi:hypothetical protein
MAASRTRHERGQNRTTRTKSENFSYCVAFFDPRPGEVMPPRIGLAMVLFFAFPCLVLGVDILMDPNGDGSLFSASFARRSSDTLKR